MGTVRHSRAGLSRPSRRVGLRDERGVALIEFAMVLPVLMVLLLAMLELGKAFNYWIDQTHLANEGARWAAVNRNPGGGMTLQDYIRSRANTDELRTGGTYSVPNALKVCISFPTGTTAIGDPVKVAVTTQYHFVPYIGDELGLPSVGVTGSATMRIEQPPTNYGAGPSSGSTCP
jgi:Flp pilus assembly protein TadG